MPPAHTKARDAARPKSPPLGTREALNFRFAQFEIDTARHELRRAGAVVHIEPQVFDVIVYLVKNRERIVTKDELIELDLARTRYLGRGAQLPHQRRAAGSQRQRQ